MAMDVSPEKMIEVLSVTINRLKESTTLFGDDTSKEYLMDSINIISYAEHFLRMYKQKHGVE